MAVVRERLVEVEANGTVVSDRAGRWVRRRPSVAYDPDQVLLMAPVLFGVDPGGGSGAFRLGPGGVGDA